VFLYTVGVSGGASYPGSRRLSGLAPALGLLRPNLADALREDGRNTPGRRAHRFRGLLVAAQLAVSLVLLIGAS